MDLDDTLKYILVDIVKKLTDNAGKQNKEDIYDNELVEMLKNRLNGSGFVITHKDNIIDIEQMVKEFHNVYEVPIKDKAGLPHNDRRLLRDRLIREEYNEWFTGEARDDIVEIADGLIDLVYVIVGTCLEYGLPFNQLFKEVHKSNMSKLGDDGKPVRRGDGKVLKGPNFKPPEIARILIEGK